MDNTSNTNTSNVTDTILSILKSRIKTPEQAQANFKAFCSEYRQRITTGYLALDKILNGGIFNELYILLAESCVGKSAFTFNLAQNMAKPNEKGENAYVLYFSLEMSEIELRARAVSEISFRHHAEDNNEPVYTASEILQFVYNEQTQDFEQIAYSNYAKYDNEYTQMYKDLYIIEGGLDGFTANDVALLADNFRKEHPEKPTIVFVDYLQLLKSDPEDPAQRDLRVCIKEACRTLKVLASQYRIPVFTISSVARTSYGEGVSMASGKESGEIEYTGGVVISFDWEGVTNTKQKSDREAEIEACKMRGYRRIKISTLKQRNNERFQAVNLRYYPGYNTFVDEHTWHPDSDGEAFWIDSAKGTKKTSSTERNKIVTKPVDNNKFGQWNLKTV